MIKRILMIMLSLVLLCGMSARAEEAYEKIGSAMYRIVLRTEEGDQTLGSGVLFVDQHVLLTALGCCVQGDLYAIGEDGEHAILDWSAAENAGVAMMEMATPSTAEPLMLANSDAKSLPFIFGANEQGKTGSMPLYLVRRTMDHNRDALLLTGEEGLLPGAFMTDQNGQIIGLVLSQHMEGVGSYLALDSNALYDVLLGDETDAEAFLDITVSWADGMLNIAWQDEERQSGLYLITLSGDNNYYYTSYEAEKEEKSISLPVPPGHTYYVQVQWAESADQALSPVWSAMKTFTVPVTAFTSHGFTQESYLGSAPAGKKVTAVLTEMPLISVDTLTDKKTDIYLQICNTYDVSAEFTVPMTVELIAPDGQFYFEEMSYTFSPEYEADDSFIVSVEDLLSTCVEFSRGTLHPGSYVLRYSLSGKVAGEYAFTVQEAGTAAPASAQEEPQTTGFATGVTAENESGLITLSWDAASIPEGAKVNAYYFYEGNTYTTYHQMQEGASSTQLFSVPGRRVMAWVVWSMEGDAVPVMPDNQEEYAIVPATEEMPLEAYSFKNLRLGLVPSSDPKAATKMEYLPSVPLTREILSDRNTPIYFQTEDTYRISATSQDHPMVIVLCTPEGLCFVEPGYYIFDLTLQSSDLWLKDISKLFANYESIAGADAWPAGEYRVLYCIDDKIAGEYTFTLE